MKRLLFLIGIGTFLTATTSWAIDSIRIAANGEVADAVTIADQKIEVSSLSVVQIISSGTIISNSSASVTTQNQMAVTISTNFVVLNPGFLGIGTNAMPSSKLDIFGGSITVRGTNAGINLIGTMTATGLNIPSGDVEIARNVTNAGISWSTRTSPSDDTWRTVTYGNGLFVAGNISNIGNRIGTSPDGINWTLRRTPADNNVLGIVYGNGLFVAITAGGVGNNIMTSPDGMNWTSRTSTEDSTWRGIAYGTATFVAVAEDGTNRVATSPDGITWTARSASVANGWRDVTYGNGLFVAVAISGTGNRVMTSPDGITWTTRTSAADNDWYRIVYGNGLFVAVSLTGSGNRVMTSPDGITWTTRTNSVENQFTNIVYGDGLFVAVALDTTGGNTVMTSPDGITWTTRTSAADNGWNGLAYGNGIFVAVGTSGTGNRVMTSGKINSNEQQKNNIYQGGITLNGGLISNDFVTVIDSMTVSGSAQAATGEVFNVVSGTFTVLKDGRTGLGTNAPTSRFDMVGGSITSRGTDAGLAITGAAGAGNGFNLLQVSTGATNLFTVSGTSIVAAVDIYKNATAYTNPDYVFEKDYVLMPIEELEKFVEKNKHLPNMPSTKEIEEKGVVNLTETNRLLIEKVEELYLYVFKLEERLSQLESLAGITREKDD